MFSLIHIRKIKYNRITATNGRLEENNLYRKISSSFGQIVFIPLGE
jgi:hypothetical protein